MSDHHKRVGEALQSALEREPDAGGESRYHLGPPLEPDGDGRLVSNQPPVIKALPPDAPVRALGTYENKLYFLDAHSQLRELGARDLNRLMITHLFGSETDWIYRLWPTLKKSGEHWIITGWEGTKAQESLMRACARRGIWRPQDFVKGRGTWDAGEGRLVVHAGHKLYFSSGEIERPGLVGRTVFPAAPRATVPAEGARPIDGLTAGREILALLETWNFQREFDARLLLGWVVASLMAGALKVRPLVWVTGEKGTGKSSLVGEGGVIHSLFGDGILMTANTTAAGLYQKIGYDALPIAIDEIEAKRGNQKTEAVIELARQAYSGGMVLRGGADHEGKEFRAMCPVLFGSILIPPLNAQDMSRLALLRLDPFPADAREPEIDHDRLTELGRALLRRVLEKWGDWSPRLAAWREFMRELGHDGRAADQFGTLLAAADFVLSDTVPDDDQMRVIAGGMAPSALDETQVESSNATRCVGYAMSRPISAMRGGEVMMISELVLCALRRFGGDMRNPVRPLDASRFLERSGVTVLVQRHDGKALETQKPHKVQPQELARVLDQPRTEQGEGVFVGFSPDGDGILELFRGSDWEGVPGAHNPYTQALGRVVGAKKAEKSLRVGARTCRPLMVPVEECVSVPTQAEVATGRGYDDD